MILPSKFDSTANSAKPNHMQCTKIVLASALISSVDLLQQCKNTTTHQINISLAVNNKDQPAISDPVVSLCSYRKDVCT